MAILEIPTRTDISVYDFSIELDSEVFTLSFVYNVRAAHWFVSFLDVDGEPVRQGLKLVSNAPMLLPWVQQGRPQGELVAANAENDDDPDRDTLGTSSILCYDEGGAFG